MDHVSHSLSYAALWTLERQAVYDTHNFVAQKQHSPKPCVTFFRSGKYYLLCCVYGLRSICAKVIAFQLFCLCVITCERGNGNCIRHIDSLHDKERENYDLDVKFSQFSIEIIAAASRAVQTNAFAAREYAIRDCITSAFTSVLSQGGDYKQ